MQIDTSENSLPVYKALDSPVRLQIINLLSNKKLSVQQLQEQLGLSSAVLLMHLDKLGEAKIVTFERDGHKKIAKLNVGTINILFPNQDSSRLSIKNVEMPVGQYSDFSVQPSCGLAGPSGYIGQVDNPASYSDPDRVSAKMIWWTKGFVEYKFPNYLNKMDKLEILELSMELGSEFPFSKRNWPSDITFTINGVDIGMWTSPGDFADHRGKYTPEWVPNRINQYGLLTQIRVTAEGSYINNQLVSPVTINDLNSSSPIITVRYGIKSDAINNGGCTIFGKGFGNYDQDINMKVYYS